MKNPYTSPPGTEQDLLQRTGRLAGMSLGQVAQALAVNVPHDLARNKGWVGEIAERYLGATAATMAEPDFQSIGVELKTVPIGKQGTPRESTYVCTVSLDEKPGTRWPESVVWKKLARVLWLPVEADTAIPMHQRRFGNSLLWSPDREQEQILRNDWEELMELVCTGELENIKSEMGRYLQIRPKAAHARVRGQTTAQDGTTTTTLPRGFYLRASFTRLILENNR